MKGLFKIIFGSMLGFLLSLLFIIFILVGAASSIGKTKSVKIDANSILEIKLDGSLPDRSNDDAFSNFNVFTMEPGATLGLFKLKKMIEQAKTDDKIKGLYLRTDFLNESFATLSELNRVIEDFKSSGKFVIAYNNFSTQRSYAVNCAADEIFLHPSGAFEFDGLSSERMYYKGLFEKLDVEPMIFYSGQYKSYSEPYRLSEMSEKNREQTRELLGDIYKTYLEDIASDRNLNSVELESWADNLEIQTPEDALEKGLIDGLKYEDEMLNYLLEKMGYDNRKQLKFVTLEEYATHVNFVPDVKIKDQVAIVYAEGGFAFGESNNQNITGQEYMELFRDLREDDNIKAIVLRINSGGGVAFTGDQIWKEIVETKKIKPVVVSMGNVAASAGYMIAAPADTIFAEKNTITGSIGVVGILFNMEDFFNNKLGITFDREGTGPYADFGNMNREWTEKEIDIVTKQVTDLYEDFKSKVAEGRNMTMEQVEEIAQGRVWSGEDAIEIGLVDRLGSLDDAVATAAKMAKIESYRTSTFPQPEKFLDKLLKGDLMAARAEKRMKAELGIYYDQYKKLMSLKEMEGMQARLPYEIVIK